MESFYCSLKDCDFDYAYTKSFAAYKCQSMKCKCVPGRMLCGENGSLDLTEWLDSKEEGPVRIIKMTL